MTVTPYISETLDLLGDQDPVAVLTETPSWISARVEGLTLDQLRRPEGPGKWSLAQVMEHLADAEIAYGWRARIVLTSGRPTLTGWDQLTWMTRFHGREGNFPEAFQTFSTVRHWNLPVWSDVSASDLERIGMHAERGPESFEFMRRITAGHDLRHRRQIDRILGTLR